jgi:hypothetical protein
MKISVRVHYCIILLILSSGYCYAQKSAKLTDEEASGVGLDVALTDPLLSLKYQRGKYLVYDCIDRHWVCTGKAEFDLCLEQRDVGLLDKNSRMPCGAFDYFENEKKCQKHQKKLINRGDGTRFCYNLKNDSVEKVY